MAERSLSLSQSAERYRIGQSTLRKWIKRDILSAELVPIHGKEQYQILVAELERVLKKRGMMSDVVARNSTEQDRADQDERITDLEKRVAALEREIAMLRQATRPRTPLSDPSAPAPPRSVPEPRYTQPIPDLPDGTVTLQQFADELGITRSTIMGHLEKEHYQDTAVPVAGGLHKHYFTVEQAEAARVYHREHPPKGKRG